MSPIVSVFSTFSISLSNSLLISSSYEDIIFPEEYLVLTCDKYIPDVLLGTKAERVAHEDHEEDTGEAQGYGTFVEDLISDQPA